MVNLPTKFEVPNFTRRENMKGVARCRNGVLPLLHLTPPAEGLPWDDLRKILYGVHRIARLDRGEEILPKCSTA